MRSPDEFKRFGSDVRFDESLEPTTRPTGQEIFDSLSPEKQDEMLGPEAADMVRRGEATLSDFVQRDGGFITQKPVEKVKAYNPNQPRDARGRWGTGGGPLPTYKPDRPPGKPKPKKPKGASVSKAVEANLTEAALYVGLSVPMIWDPDTPDGSADSATTVRLNMNRVKRVKKRKQWKTVVHLTWTYGDQARTCAVQIVAGEHGWGMSPSPCVDAIQQEFGEGAPA